ncbi:GDP-L-fucose synthase [Spirulina sp. 06S082]|uniref:GDP-L-fucose synthase family protein n=1 Tax=Spirulina sp. 06S082 TaxID=3110248 RepID=UPI002B1FE97D|nr:GDP-L-fucose synthase [Spirulina sp. 06S082]MEA5468537.1 GDP-L-fucose synthase [Spirulina sp. 06S082]
MKRQVLYIAGHTGLVGSALLRRTIRDENYAVITRTRAELDLMNSDSVAEFMQQESPDRVIIAAGRVGGILANQTYCGEFIHQNLTIQNNLIHQSMKAGVKSLVFLGSSCMYPKHCPQPMSESALLTGLLEETNLPYAIAKISGWGMCQAYNQQYGMNYMTAIPANLYGRNDNFHPQDSHVIPGMIRRFHEAKIQQLKEVVVWGTGKPKREFLLSDDLADALLFLLEKNYHSSQPINIGSGQEVSISELAETIKEIVGFDGHLIFDTHKPDGMPLKRLDNSQMEKLAWSAKTSLAEGIQKVYEWCLNSKIFEKIPFY